MWGVKKGIWWVEGLQKVVWVLIGIFACVINNSNLLVIYQSDIAKSKFVSLRKEENSKFAFMWMIH